MAEDQTSRAREAAIAMQQLVNTGQHQQTRVSLLPMSTGAADMSHNNRGAVGGGAFCAALSYAASTNKKMS
jgi:hypothetical protein